MMYRLVTISKNEWWHLITAPLLSYGILRQRIFQNSVIHSYSDQLQWNMICFVPKADPPVYLVTFVDVSFSVFKILSGCVGLIIMLATKNNQFIEQTLYYYCMCAHQITEKFFAHIQNLHTLAIGIKIRIRCEEPFILSKRMKAAILLYGLSSNYKQWTISDFS